ncbi:ester cyclase [Wenzhouxiangella sp. XN201]|uniref:ester cyclase n=1 Tax=Wenzhouxiangella sp. XN201 TaxID=2710755 RepID=UPI0013CB7C97|nr:ester cyclase [Wenzhouxiangella sp. XN201]NEZ02990.1 ester cyclase [Wenzhouxiangella sp. XN201]
MKTELIETNVETVKEFLAKTHSWGLPDLEVIDRTVDPQIVCHGFAGGNPDDRESYKNWFRTFRKSFSEMDFRIARMVADHEHVAVQWTVAVTHSGEFAGLPATGRRVEFDGMVFYRLENGRIAETWLSIDMQPALSQIGAVSHPLA